MAQRYAQREQRDADRADRRDPRLAHLLTMCFRRPVTFGATLWPIKRVRSPDSPLLEQDVEDDEGVGREVWSMW